MASCILIADDNKFIRAALRALFANHKTLEVCYEAEDGADAVEKVARHKPALAILDFAMPVMDGVAAAARISEIAPEVPVILCTLHSDVLTKGKLSGVARVVSKMEGEELVRYAEELTARQIRRSSGSTSI
jgi:CheY-like chemotaxis protein